MKKVNFYKITGPLPTFDSKYEGLFVYTTNDKKLFLGVNGSWSELTNNEILDIIEQNEIVVSSALNDLNERIDSMHVEIRNISRKLDELMNNSGV